MTRADFPVSPSRHDCGNRDPRRNRRGPEWWHPVSLAALIGVLLGIARWIHSEIEEGRHEIAVLQAQRAADREILQSLQRSLETWMIQRR